MDVIFSIILFFSWLTFIGYIVANKKQIPINIYGLMLLVGIIQTYILGKDIIGIMNEQCMFRWDTLLTKILTLITFTAVVKGRVKFN